MNPFHTYVRRVRAFFNRGASERDIADEMQFHVDMESQSLEQRGASHEDAAVEARRRFGSADRYAEELRDVRGGRRADAWLQDLRYALRLVRRSPGFAAMVILTLGLAIGANTAVFSVVNAVLLAPLAFEKPEEVVVVYSQNPDASQPRFSVSYPDYIDWQRETRSFAEIALYGGTVLTLTGDGDPERLSGLVATPNFLHLLGVRPYLGRFFQEGDDDATISNAVILSHGLWKRRFGADSSVIGKSVQFGGRARVVVAVLPASFVYDGRPIDAMIGLTPAAVPAGGSHAQHLFESVARLRPGVSVAQAQAELQAVAKQIAAAHSEIAGWSANVFEFSDELVRGRRTPLLILLGASGLVLLIGCINVANLLSVRAAARGREVGLRQALGASRRRLVSQLLTESLVLAGFGGVLGVAIATVGTRTIAALVPRGVLPRFSSASLDLRVLGFAALASGLTAVLVGLWPALRATEPGVLRSLREGGRGGTGGSHAANVRRVLVVAEMSLALVLLICSGLVLQSLNNIANVDPGFLADGVSTMRVSLGGSRYPNDTALVQFYRELSDRVRSFSGIERVSAANTPPIAGGGIITPIRLPGEERSDADRRMSPVTAITPGYFSTLGIRIIRGHDITWSDPGAALLASESAARTLWPGEDPLGERVIFGSGGDGLEVVGVVADSRSRGLTVPPVPMLYMSFVGAANIARTMSIVVRGPASHEARVAAIRAAIHDMDPALPIYNVATVQSVIDQTIAQPRLNTTLLTVFAGLALLLAAIGIYGVISFSVAQRIQEFGVRMALGAQSSDVLRLVLREGGLLAAAGILIGVAGAVGATTLIRTWLFGVGRGDLTTYGATAGVLLAIAFAATYIPARRATRVDPVIAMRGE